MYILREPQTPKIWLVLHLITCIDLKSHARKRHPRIQNNALHLVPKKQKLYRDARQDHFQLWQGSVISCEVIPENGSLRRHTFFCRNHEILRHLTTIWWPMDFPSSASIVFLEDIEKWLRSQIVSKDETFFIIQFVSK